MKAKLTHTLCVCKAAVIDGSMTSKGKPLPQANSIDLFPDSFAYRQVSGYTQRDTVIRHTFPRVVPSSEFYGKPHLYPTLSSLVLSPPGASVVLVVLSLPSAKVS